MNRLLCTACIFALVVPSIAAAQPQNDKQNGHRQHAARPQNGGGQNGARPAGGAGHGQPVQNRMNRPSGERPQMTTQPAPTANSRPSRQGRPSSAGRPTVQSVPNRGQRPGVRPSNFQPVRAPAFRYPRGYHYRRWNIGLILPSIFLSNYYFYNNWAALGAYPPPPGFVWVRYGPDLLLVSRRSGRIRDVIYGAFY